MKGFYQYLAPFAPDYSGAAAVLYGCGGLNVLCDPGGCSGNVCGYDEPRFYGGDQALYSAAIRDLDTILGKDDLLEKKVLQAASERDYPYIALIGSPVVSIIATDLNALGRMVERKCGIKSIAIDCDGMASYEKGQGKAYVRLLRAFGAKGTGEARYTGILGATPLDTLGLSSPDEIRAHYGENAFLYGDGCTLERLANLSSVAKNVVVSPSGLAAAREMQQKFGVPYEVDFPENPAFDRVVRELDGKSGRILIVHQQTAASALREKLRTAGHADVTVGSFNLMDAQCSEPGDINFKDEDDFIEAVSGYETVVGDALYRSAPMGAAFVPLTHFALSGDLYL